MMVRHIRLDRRQFYLFEGLGINSLFNLCSQKHLLRAIETRSLGFDSRPSRTEHERFSPSFASRKTASYPVTLILMSRPATSLAGPFASRSAVRHLMPGQETAGAFKVASITRR
jgi:hypothetical protein